MFRARPCDRTRGISHGMKPGCRENRATGTVNSADPSGEFADFAHAPDDGLPPRRQRPEIILRIEAIGFSTLIVASWVAELVGVPHLFFSEMNAINWLRPVAKTLTIVGVWVPVHLATRALLARLRYLEDFMLVCGWCRKVGHDGEWMSLDQYFQSAHADHTSHGICPECSAAFLKDLVPPLPTTPAPKPESDENPA